MLLDPGLGALQDDFRAAIWAQAAPDGLTASGHTDTALRFAVYRNNVQHSLTRALAARFGVVERLVGAEFFTAMARVFIAAHPPRDPVLLRWGDDFAGFLEGFPPVAHLPFLPDVARLEYLRGRAYHAGDAAPVAADALAVPDPSLLQMQLHPSVQLFRSGYPAVQIWQAHQSDATAPLTAGPDYALIARQQDFVLVTTTIDASTYAVLAALVAGDTLGAAAATADPTAALTLLLHHGLIIHVQTGTSP